MYILLTNSVVVIMFVLSDCKIYVAVYMPHIICPYILRCIQITNIMYISDSVSFTRSTVITSLHLHT